MMNHPKANPFTAGPAISRPERFYGRAAELQAIASRVGGVSAQSLSIVGARRMGKSSLLQQIRQRANLPADSPYRLFYTPHHYVVLGLDLSGPTGKSNRALMEGLRRALQRHQLPAWEKADNGDLTVLSYALEDLAMDYPDQRVVLCLDEFEYINDHPAEFDGLLEALRYEGSQGRLAIVTASATPLHDLCRQGRIKTSPFFNIFTQVSLGPFTEEVWRQLLTDGLGPLSPAEWEFVAHSQRHPFLSQLAGQMLWQARQNGPVDLARLTAELTSQAAPFRAYDNRKLRAEAELKNYPQLIWWLYDDHPELYDRLRAGMSRADILRWLAPD